MPLDNPVIRFLNKMTDLIILNILFVICSLPIVTIGASLTAMYAVSLRSVRYGDGYVVANFFKSFKKNFAQSTIVWIGIMVIAGIFYVDYMFWSQSQMGIVSTIMLVVSFAMAFLCLIASIWIFPIIAKMEDRLLAQIRNAAAMAIGHFFPYTAMCVGLLVFVTYMVYINVGAMFIMLCIGFATLSYIFSFFVYKVFAKYIQEESAGNDDLLYGQGEEDEN